MSRNIVHALLKRCTSVRKNTSVGTGTHLAIVSVCMCACLPAHVCVCVCVCPNLYVVLYCLLLGSHPWLLH